MKAAFLWSGRDFPAYIMSFFSVREQTWNFACPVSACDTKAFVLFSVAPNQVFEF
jgi:hypothetical protein